LADRRYEKLLFVHKDIRTVTVSHSTGETEPMTMQKFYNQVFLPCAKRFIVNDTTILERKKEGDEGGWSLKSKEDSVADRLLQKMQLNSPLKETLPSHAPEKIRILPFSGFSYHPKSPIGNDYLISRSPDAMRAIIGVNQAV
jgi:hypothetical protein